MAACCALRIFDAATICIAFVICAVPPIDLIRRLRSRGLCISASSFRLPAFSFRLPASGFRLLASGYQLLPCRYHTEGFTSRLPLPLGTVAKSEASWKLVAGSYVFHVPLN